MTLDQLSGLDISGLRRLARTTPSPDATAPTGDGKVAAISYLRVSTKDQATRNELAEGLSIPAQRRALQNLLDYVTENPVQYCIINKVDRLARNRLDDALIHATLRDANISLVSVTENIDETPSGMLMHGILASMAEFYSLNLAQEVLKA